MATQPEDALAAAEAKLVDYVLDQALAAEPHGVPVSECDAALRGDAARALHGLVYEHRLLALDSGIYYATLLAMRRRPAAFADSIAPLQGVVSHGHQVLDDRGRPEKSASVDDVVFAIVNSYAALSSTPVRVRFNWALFGLAPYVEVTASQHRVPMRLHFRPALYEVATLDDVFRAQQLLGDEEGILDKLREGYRETRNQRRTAMELGKSERVDRALRSLVAKGEAELLGTGRVVIAESALEPDVIAAGALLPGESAWPPVTMPREVERPESELQPLLDRLVAAGALSEPFAKLLERDASEVAICLHSGAYKAALILCGSILEGVLVSVLSQNAPRADAEFKLRKGNQRRSFPEDASLPELVWLARKPDLSAGLRPLLGEVQRDLAHLITAHRDLVHPHAEVREEALPINGYTAAAVHANLCVVLDEVALRVEDGWLEHYRAA